MYSQWVPANVSRACNFRRCGHGLGMFKEKPRSRLLQALKGARSASSLAWLLRSWCFLTSFVLHSPHAVDKTKLPRTQEEWSYPQRSDVVVMGSKEEFSPLSTAMSESFISFQMLSCVIIQLAFLPFTARWNRSGSDKKMLHLHLWQTDHIWSYITQHPVTPSKENDWLAMQSAIIKTWKKPLSSLCSNMW